MCFTCRCPPYESSGRPRGIEKKGGNYVTMFCSDENIERRSGENIERCTRYNYGVVLYSLLLLSEIVKAERNDVIQQIVFSRYVSQPIFITKIF